MPEGRETVSEQNEIERAAESEEQNLSEVSAEQTKPVGILKKIIRIVLSVISWTIVGAFAAAALFLLGVRLFGYRPFAIESPSMTPTYPVGCLVYAKKTAFENIKVGDAITFATPNCTAVTHRVARIDEENRMFYTKGDANEEEDGNPTSYENVVGVVRFAIPLVGHLTLYAATRSGKYAVITVFLFLLLLLLLPALIASYKKEDKKE